MESSNIRVGITQGDINGVGYEVILKALSDPRIYEEQAVIIYGSAKVAAYHKKTLDIANVNLTQINSAKEAQVGRVSVLTCIDDDVKVELTQSTAIAGKASFQALEKACLDLKEGLIDVLVTAPINKNNIQSAQFSFPGHTEYLESVFGEGKKALMIMAGPLLKIAVATGHIPISQVASELDVQSLVQKLKIFNRTLIRDFGIVKPRIAVLGLNPHAGDGGVIGTEDDAIVAEAIKKSQDNHVCCFGPIPADGFFGSGEFALYDGVLAMYHDQGLIPFKTLNMESGVNYTAGLPVVRTSPAHGTAYHLAGLDQASEVSFREAYYMACDVFQNRRQFDDMSKNPLKKQHLLSTEDSVDLNLMDERN